jgi:hypothetical protein
VGFLIACLPDPLIIGPSSYHQGGARLTIPDERV